jgi:hypothetical protein
VSDLAALRHRLDAIFDARDRAFPRRDPANTATMWATLDAYVTALRARRRPGWTPDPARLAEAGAMRERAVFVGGYMKSGTTFLTALLDGHPELTVVPGEGRLLDNLVDRQRDRPYAERRRDQDRYWVARLANPTGQRPFWFLGPDDAAYVEFVEYLEHWLGTLPEADRSPFLAAVLALHGANPRRAARPRAWVEKTPGNELRVAALAALFPDARFAHIVREPLTTLASMKRLRRHRGWGRLPGPAWIAGEARRLRRSIEAGLAAETALGPDRYRLVRYEDLVCNPRAEMEKVAAFLGIGWDDALLTPTVNGEPASANSMYEDRRRRGAVVADGGERRRRDLGRAERLLATAILAPTARRCGYGA